MKAGWRAVPLPDGPNDGPAERTGAWTAASGSGDLAVLAGPGRWAVVTATDLAAEVGRTPMRTATGAAAVPGRPGAVVVVGAIEDRPAACFTSPGRQPEVVELPGDGAVAHWPVLSPAPDRGVLVLAWAVGGGGGAQVRLADVRADAPTSVTPAGEVALPAVPWRLRLGVVAGEAVLLVSDASGTRLVHPDGATTAVPGATGASDLSDGVVTSPHRDGGVTLFDVAGGTSRHVAIEHAEGLRSARTIRTGGSHLLVWETAGQPEAGLLSTSWWCARAGADDRLGAATPLPAAAGVVAALGDRLLVAPADGGRVVFVGGPQ